jgi:hypothetical protein
VPCGLVAEKYLLIYAPIVVRMPLKTPVDRVTAFEKTANAVEGILCPDRFYKQQLLPIELFESAEKDTNSPFFRTQNQP